MLKASRVVGLLAQLNSIQTYYEKICLTQLKIYYPMINCLLFLLLTVITFPSLHASEHLPYGTSNTTAQLLDLFTPHHAMGGFSKHHKEMMMVTHQCFRVKEDDGRQTLLNMFDYHGAMHLITQ